jgi:hypothetical protein
MQQPNENRRRGLGIATRTVARPNRDVVMEGQ